MGRTGRGPRASCPQCGREGRGPSRAPAERPPWRARPPGATRIPGSSPRRVRDQLIRIQCNRAEAVKKLLTIICLVIAPVHRQPVPAARRSGERVPTAEEVGFSLGGTDGSNPSPSSGESRANLNCASRVTGRTAHERALENRPAAHVRWADRRRRVVVVDNGSTDNTAEIIHGWAGAAARSACRSQSRPEELPR
jgi:hypothetical protein